MSTRARFAFIGVAAFTLSLLVLDAGAQHLSPVSERVAGESAIQLSSAHARDAEARGYVIRSSGAHTHGKYYFEVVVDSAARRKELEALVIARVNDGTRWFGTRYDIRPREDATFESGGERREALPSAKIVMGIAVDLDAGRFYRHRDGVWLDGAAPGSPRGIELRRGAPYVAELASSAPLEPFLRNDIVAVNFGNAPFLRQPPEGYAGFDSTETAANDVPPAEAAVVVFPYRLP